MNLENPKVETFVIDPIYFYIYQQKGEIMFTIQKFYFTFSKFIEIY